MVHSSWCTGLEPLLYFLELIQMWKCHFHVFGPSCIRAISHFHTRGPLPGLAVYGVSRCNRYLRFACC